MKEKTSILEINNENTSLLDRDKNEDLKIPPVPPPPLSKHNNLKSISILLIFYSITVISTFYYGQIIPNIFLNYVELKYPTLTGDQIQSKASYLKGYSESIPYFVMFLIGPFIGFLSDTKYGRKPILIFSIIISIIDVLSCLITIKTNNLIYFYIFHSIGGINNVICGTVYSSIADLTYYEQHIPLLYSLAGISLGIGVLFGPLLYIISSNYSIYILLSLYILCLIILLLFIKETIHFNNNNNKPDIDNNNNITNPFKIILNLFTKSGYLSWLFILYFSLSFTSQDIDSTFYYYCKTMYNWGKNQNAYFMGVNGILIIIYSILIPILLNYFKKLNTRNLISFGFFIGICAHIFYVFSNKSKYLYIIGATLFGNLIPTKFNLIQSAISETTPNKVKGSIITGIQSIGSIASFLGTLVANDLFMYSISNNSIIYFPQAIYLLNGIIIFITFIISLLIWKFYKS